MTVASEPWRLIVTPGGDGAWNMALDQAILEQVGAGNSPPTLRFFSWNPACLSLGQAQPAAPLQDQHFRPSGRGPKGVAGIGMKKAAELQGARVLQIIEYEQGVTVLH